MKEEGQIGFASDLKLVVFYHGFFGERFIANLMNYHNSCPSFGACGIDACVQCKENVYSFSKNIVAAFGMLDPATMPQFIEDAEDFLPRQVPEADICVAINIHPDVLAALPEKLAEAGIKALIVPVEEPRWCPPGLAKQLEAKCHELGMEFAAPKPFCILRQDESKPIISRFVREMGLGYPAFDFEVSEKNSMTKFDAVRVIRSQPCGCAWYIGIRLREFQFESMRQLWDRVAEAHHAFPCTGSMEKDNEYGETILHVAGYTARHAVNRAIGYEGNEDIPEHIRDIIIWEPD